MADSYLLETGTDKVLMEDSSLYVLDDLGLPLMDTLTDDFASFDAVKWFQSPTNTDVTGGQLLLTCNSSYDSYFGSGVRYSLLGSQMLIEAVSLPSVGNGTRQVVYRAKFDNNTGLVMSHGSGVLLYGYRSGATDFLASLTYDATNHRWWRIREASGTVYFDVSPNGSTWTNLGTVPTPAYANNIEVSLSAGYYGTETSVERPTFDNFNLATTRSGWYVLIAGVEVPAVLDNGV